MAEQLRNGFVGLFLMLGQWLSPGASRPEISVNAARPAAAGYAVQCALNLAWTEEMEALVDAGIPLRLRIGSFCDGCDSVVFLRTLRLDIAELTYSFTDTFVTCDSTFSSATYPQVLLALRDLSRWTFLAPPRARTCRVEAELLSSRAARLNRTVDMSALWGQKKVSKVVMLGDLPRRR